MNTAASASTSGQDNAEKSKDIFAIYSIFTSDEKFENIGMDTHGLTLGGCTSPKQSQNNVIGRQHQ